MKGKFDWFGLVLWHINHCSLLNAKSSIHMYQMYVLNRPFDLFPNVLGVSSEF